MPNTPGPALVALSVWQGQTFDAQLAFEDASGNPIDLTGYSAQMMLRNDVADPAPVVTWSDTTGEIMLGGTAGTLTFNVAGTATQALPTGNEVTQWWYDILITNGAVPPFSQRLVYGQLTAFPAITRPDPSGSGP
jgi:hypothetical protein